ncbi:hypothetical protein WN943_025859 [Citrus x changshan-huyou]
MRIQKLASIALALDPRLPSLHQGRANAENPGLILHCDFPSSNELYSVNLEQYNNQITSINARLKSSISEYHIVGSSNGMLCIASALHSKPIFACNPFGRDFIELQSGLGDDAWRSLGRPLIPWRVNPGPSQALLNGALHWLSKCHNQFPSRASPCSRILSFDLAEEKLKEIGRPSCGSLDCCRFHLVVLRGCLSAVHCSDDEGIHYGGVMEQRVCHQDLFDNKHKRKIKTILRNVEYFG